MARLLLQARNNGLVEQRNRRGLASTSDRNHQHRRLFRPRQQQQPPSLVAATTTTTTARASLWDRARSLFGGGESSGDSKRPKQSEEGEEEEGIVLLDPDSLPDCLPAAVVSRTFLAGRALAVAYRGSTHGWSALDFHARCDFKGPCLIVAEVEESGAVFGAYYSDCFQSSDDYKSSFKPFLFAFDDDEGTKKTPLSERRVFVCEKVGGPEAALFDYARGGPQFGPDGLVVGPPLSPVMGGFAGPDSPTRGGAGDLRTAKSRLGLSYAELPAREDGRRRSLFGRGNESEGGGDGGGRDEATLKEVTVYFSPELARMYR